MRKKSYYFTLFMVLLGVIFWTLIVILERFYTATPQEIAHKNLFVQTTLLPDLALSNTSYYIRHRSLSSLFSIYGYDGTLREFDITSFTYAPSGLHNNTPLKVLNDTPDQYPSY